MDVNIGGVTNREALKVINVINYYIKNNIGIGLDIREWIVYNVELKKDIKYSSSKEKKIIIDTYKKCSRGNMKTGEYKSSYYRFSNNGNKISIYDKEEEVKSHRSWGRVKIEEKAIIHDTVRFEVAFSQKKLRKILDVKDKVLFKNLLNVGIQEKIYNDFFLKMGFKVGEMPTKTALIKDIKNLALGTKKIENLITFVETLNIYTFKKVKELFPSAYTYLKILRDNNLAAYFIDTEKILEEAIKESKVKENTFYSSILNGCYEVLYNIYYIINNIFILREIKLE